jgi:hypothetical protein
MTSNPFKPPAAEVDDPAHVRQSARPWHLLVVAAACYLIGIVRVLIIVVLGLRAGLDLGLILISCLIPVLWCILAYLVYTRSRFALAGSVVSMVVPYLLGPWVRHLITASVSAEPMYDYWGLVSRNIQASIPDLAICLVIVGYCAMAHRRRFMGTA